MAKCTHLEWAVEPHIPPCAIGEPADHRGLKFYAVYDDGSRQEVDVILKMFHELNLQAEGTERLAQITYEKKKLPVQVPLKNITLTSVQAVPRGELRCMEGEPFDRSQVVVSAVYSDGSSRVIDNYKIAPHQALSMSDEKITFRYGRCTFDLPIAVRSNQTSTQPQPEQATIQPMVPAQPNPLDPAQSSAQSQSQTPTPAPVPQPQTPPKPSVQPPSAGPTNPTPPPINHPIPSPAPVQQPSKTVVAVSVARKPNHQKYLVGDTMVDLKGGLLDIIYSDGSVGQIDMMADGPVYIDSKKPGTGSISFVCLGKPVAFPIDVLEPQIVKLSVVKQPAKLDYTEGEKLNLAGLVLEVVYNDGSIRTVRGLQSNGFIVEMGHEDEGVTLSYEGKPFTIRVRVKKKEVPITVLSVELTHEPTKTRYVENDPQGLDLTGAELLVQMSDGRRLPIPVTPDMIDPVDLTRPGRCLLNIRYMGHTVTCSIFVSARTLMKLELKSPMNKMEYIEGEKIDIRGLAIEACYDNGDRTPAVNYAVTPERALSGIQEIQVSYEGASLSIPITVHPLEITLLDWARQPLKTIYYTEESEFSCDGGVLRVKWNNGSEEDVPLKPEMVSGFRTDRVGPLLLTVTYKKKTVPLTLTIKERLLLGLQVIKKPRTEYTEGESFDPSGVVVEALYSGETSEVVGVNYLPYGPLKLDTVSVMLVYQDKAVVMPITVSAPKSPEHLPIIARPMSAETLEQGPVLPLPRKEEKAEPEVREKQGDVVQKVTEPEVPVETASQPQPVAEEPVVEAVPEQDPFAEKLPSAEAQGEDARDPAGKRRWANVPAFYPSTFCMRFSDEAFI